MFSYALHIQGAVYNLLTSTQEIFDDVGEAIFDTVPSHQQTPDKYIVIGADQVFDRGSKTHDATLALVEISVFSKETGLSGMKRIGDNVVKVLSSGALNLAPAKLVYTKLKSSRTYRTRGGALNIMRIQFNILVDTTISQ